MNTWIYLLFLIISFSIKTVTAGNILKIIPLKSEIIGNSVNPSATGVNPRTNSIYVASSGDIYVIDGKTNNSKNTVRIKNGIAFPVRGLVVNPSTNRIYVAGLNGFVIVIDGRNNKIINTIRVWFGSSATKGPDIPLFSAGGVAVNPITNHIYITHSGNMVSVINGKNNRVVDTITLAKIESVQGVKINPITNRIYVTGSALSVIDGKTNKVIDTIKVEGTEVAVNPVTNRIYVGGTVVSVIDGRLNQLVDTFRVGKELTKSLLIGVNVTTNRYYTADPYHDSVSIIDGETNEITETLVVKRAEGAKGIGINPVTNLVYVTYINSDNVVVIKDEGVHKRTQNLISSGKLFTLNCSNNLQTGAAGLEKLVLGLGEDEKCVLKLTHLEPGVPIEVKTNLMKSSQSPIKVNPESEITDSNGEIEFTISAVSSGEDWIEWAVLNENGEFDFSKEAYDAGTAWGMFVEVR